MQESPFDEQEPTVAAGDADAATRGITADASANPDAAANPADANPVADTNPAPDANPGDGGAAPTGNASPDGTISNGTLPNPDQPRMSVEEILARNADQPTYSDSDPSFWERINNGEVPGVVPAFAPAQHYNMTQDASERAGFSSDVAASIAAATRNVDYTHFSEPHMHANANENQTPEQAAEHNINVATENGSHLRQALDRYQADPTPANGQGVVDVLGRINHHMQDAYAHEGMSFGQHAHMDREGNSPDHDPARIAAGTAMTQQLMATVAADMRERGIDPASFQARSRWRQPLPSLGQVVPMLQYQYGNHQYDGRETRWDAGTNGRMFEGLMRGLRTR
ncbi:MAG TPA: hypothetical protein VIV11_37945 [Kofleriaceae bacterium]